MEFHVPMVLHADHGPFALTAEMRDRLEAREVEWLSRCARASDGRWYLPYDDELRRDPDLVDVVRQLERQLESETAELESWVERREVERRLLHGARVVRVRVRVVVEDRDGRESVRVAGGVW